MRLRSTVVILMVGVLIGLLTASLFVTAEPAAPVESTRQPVPTFTPTPVANRDDYAAAVAQAQRSLAEALADVMHLAQSPALADPEWQAGVESGMAQVEQAYQALVRVTPPEAWHPFHQQVASGAADCSAAMHVLSLALDEQEQSAVPVVGALLQRCQVKLAAAQDLLVTSGSTRPVQ